MQRSPAAAACHSPFHSRMEISKKMVIDSADGASSRPLPAPTSDPNTLEQTPQSASEDAAKSTEEKQMEARSKAYLANWHSTIRERMPPFARRGEATKKIGQPVPPPLEIVYHPDLLERAWGLDRILPYNPGNGWSLYEKFLRDYYGRNAWAHQMEASAAGHGSLNGDDGNDLAALADSCIEVEKELKFLLKRRPERFRDDEISRSDKLIHCIGQMVNVKSSEFPCAAIAMKCIAMETNLMCELVLNRICCKAHMHTSSDIWRCALRFMTYKGDEYVAAAATMIVGCHERDQSDMSGAEGGD